MSVEVEKLPNDIGELKRIIAEQQDKLSAKDEKFKRLEEKYTLLVQEKYAPKSEKRSREDEKQAHLFNEAETYADDNEEEPEYQKTKVKSHRRRKTRRLSIPADLPRTDIIHDLSDEEKICACGEELTCFAQEPRERLDIIPPRVVVHRHIHYKYACKKCEGTADESKPPVKTTPVFHLIRRSIASAGLLAWIFTAKFCDAIPFYRQEQMCKRINVDFSRATMCNLAIKTAETCSILRQQLWGELIKSPVIAIDETPLQVLNEPEKPNTSKSYMWVFRGGTKENPIVYYEYRPSRKGQFLKERLSGFSGVVMTDGFAGYNFLNEIPGIIHVNCWAHARRRFVDADSVTKKGSPLAKCFLDLIGALYAVEALATGKNMSPGDVMNLRDKESKPIIEKIKTLLNENLNSTLPKSKLGEALGYLNKFWGKLTLFLDDGKIPLDNNPLENSIRPFVLGRKNWLFSGSPVGANASAFLYTIIQTAKINGHNPYWYLRMLFELFPMLGTDDERRELLPINTSPDMVKEYFKAFPPVV